MSKQNPRGITIKTSVWKNEGICRIEVSKKKKKRKEKRKKEINTKYSSSDDEESFPSHPSQPPS